MQCHKYVFENRKSNQSEMEGYELCHVVILALFANSVVREWLLMWIHKYFPQFLNTQVQRGK